MTQVTTQIIGPYERKGRDVIVNIKETTVDVGLPPKTQSLFFLRLRNVSGIPDDEVRQLAMSKIGEYLKRCPKTLE